MQNLVVKGTRSSLSIRTEQECLDYIDTWLTVCHSGLCFYARKYQMTLDEICRIDLALYQQEQRLLDQLKPLSAAHHQQYIILSNRFTQKILKTNAYMGDSLTQTGLLPLLEEQLAIFRQYPELAEDLHELQDTYYEYGWISEPYDVDRIASSIPEQRPNTDRDAFCRYLLSRQKDFFAWIKSQYMEYPEVFKHAKIGNVYKIIEQSSVFERQALIELLPVAQPIIKAEVLKADKKEDYDAYKDKLKQINSEIRKFSNTLSPKANKETIQAYYKKYNEMCSMRDVNAQIVADRRKELGFINRTTESIKDYASKNFLDGKLGAKEFGKALACTAGKRLSIAVWREMSGNSHKNNWSDIGNELALDLLQAGVMGMASFFLGPVGGKLGESLMGFIRPQADPYLDAFQKINDKLDAEFAKTNARLDAISQQIEGLVGTIDQRLKFFGDAVVEKVSLREKIEDLKKSILDTHLLTQDIKTQYHHLHQNKQVDIEKLRQIDSKILKNIERILQIFYHKNYRMVIGEVIEAEDTSYPQRDDHSLASIMIQKYGDPHHQLFKPFDQVLTEIFDICDSIQLLATLYLGLRERYLHNLSIAMLFFQQDSDHITQELFWQIYDATHQRDDVMGELFSAVFQLKAVLVGKSNIALYHNIQQYWAQPQKFDFLNGFGLVESEGVPRKDPRQQFAFIFDRITPTDTASASASDLYTFGISQKTLDEHRRFSQDFSIFGLPKTIEEQQGRFSYGGKGRFAAASTAAPAYINRYFIAPPYPQPDQRHPSDQSYQLLTFQENDVPIPIPTKIALGIHHDLNIYYGDQFTQLQSASAVSLHDELFADSLEQLILQEKDLAIDVELNVDDVRHAPNLFTVSTPRPNYVLALKPMLTQQYGLVVRLQLQATDQVHEYPLHTFPLYPEAKAVQVEGQVKARCVEQGGFELKFSIRGNNFFWAWEDAVEHTSMNLPQLGLRCTVQQTSKPDMFFYDKVLFNNISLLPLCNVLSAGTVIEQQTGSSKDILHSLNTQYRVSFEQRYAFDVIVNLYHGNQVKGSLFRTYRYRNQYHTKLVLQTHDGHVVLYDKNNHAIAGTGVFNKEQYQNSYVLLTNRGQLHQIDQHGKFIAELSLYHHPSVECEYDGDRHLNNRLLPNRSLNINQSIESENGEYQLKFWIDVSEKPRLILSKIAGGFSEEFFFSKNSYGIYNPEHFKVVMQEDGNLVMYHHEDGFLFISSDKEVPLVASDTHGQKGAFLLLTNHGEVQIWDKDYREMLKQLNIGKNHFFSR